MELCLYINTKLTTSPAISSDILNPIYKSNTPLDSQNKSEIFALSLKSLKDLNIKKIIFNVDYDLDYIEKSDFINSTLKNVFPRAQITHEKERPTNILAWKKSTKFAREFFGEDNPIICIFNHDHIFIDQIPQIFELQIRYLFENNKDIFFLYSHAPELISLVNSNEAHNNRLLNTIGKKFSIGEPQAIGNNLFYFQQLNHIDGFFVTTAIGLENLWNSVVSSGEYAPRPDWDGVKFGDYLFNLVISGRELFRHFDGYGHVSRINSLQGMSLDHFNKDGKYIYRENIVKLLLESSITSDVIHQLSELYLKIFIESYLIAIRDAQFMKSSISDTGKNFRSDLEKILFLFLENQVKVDLNHFKITQPIFYNILYSTANKILYNQIDIFNTVHADIRLMT